MTTKSPIQKLIELDKKKALVDEYYKELAETIEAVKNEVGLDGFFQCPESQVVFQIVEPKGTFIEYKKLGYIRTKREGERAGTLSKKKAEEAGFDL